MSRWALSLPGTSLHLLGRLSTYPRIEVRVDDSIELVWIRGSNLPEELQLLLRQVAGGELFTLLPDEQLVPIGATVPTRRLPNDAWQPLHDWLRPALPAVGWPSQLPDPIDLKLARTAASSEPAAMLLSLDEWHKYAVAAPQVRLDRWRFAADAKGRVLVRGKPLPPLPGVQLVENDGLLVPAGWCWSPGVEPAVVRQLLKLQPRDCALFHTDGTWELIRQGDWVRATRSAARATAKGSDS